MTSGSTQTTDHSFDPLSRPPTRPSVATSSVAHPDASAAELRADRSPTELEGPRPAELADTSRSRSVSAAVNSRSSSSSERHPGYGKRTSHRLGQPSLSSRVSSRDGGYQRQTSHSSTMEPVSPLERGRSRGTETPPHGSYASTSRNNTAAPWSQQHRESSSSGSYHRYRQLSRQTTPVNTTTPSSEQRRESFSESHHPRPTSSYARASVEMRATSSSRQRLSRLPRQ